MPESARDLSCPDLWASSIERSLQRRRRPRRSSVQLWALREPRDLTDARVLGDSLEHARARRAAAARAAGLSPGAVRGLSVLGVLAVTATPTAAAVAAAEGSGAGPTTSSPPDPESVGALQRQLGLQADGLFGVGTARAVRRFQASHGLSSDGVVGPATRAALGLGSGPSLRQGRSGHGAPAVSATGAGTLAARGVSAARGDTTAEGVSALQARIGVPTDGDFGPLTARAVRRFQASHGLTADGVVGPATRAALGWGGGPQLVESPRPAELTRKAARGAVGQVSPSGPVPSSRPIGHAAPGGGVRALQTSLGVSPDGDFGPRTAAAVRGYQRAHGLPADGAVGPATRAALRLGAGPVLRAAAPSAANPGGSRGGGPVSSRSPSGPASSAGSGSGTSGSSSSSAIGAMTAAGDRIATTPYVYGGGHASFSSNGYDCSGSVSYVLHAAGLLASPADSTALESYGQPGPGRRVTIYANAGHAWMTIGGRRFDTAALGLGSRWSSSPGNPSGFTERHPAGL